MEGGITACSITHLYPLAMVGSTTSQPLPRIPRTHSDRAGPKLSALSSHLRRHSPVSRKTIPLVPGSPSLKNFLSSITFKKLETALQNFLVLLSRNCVGGNDSLLDTGRGIYIPQGMDPGQGVLVIQHWGLSQPTSQPSFPHRPHPHPRHQYPTILGISALPSLQGDSKDKMR